MGRRFKTAICITLMIIFSSAFTANADEINNQQNKLNDVNNSINSKKQKVDTINKTSADTQKQLSDIDVQVNEVSKKLVSLNSKVNDLNTEINNSQKLIQQHEDSLRKEDELFKSRIRAMYKSGSIAYVDIILESKSFSDILSRIEMITRIINYDTNLMNSIKTNKKFVENKKAQLQSQKNSYVKIKAEVDSEQSTLEAKSNEKKALMASLQSDKQSYEKLIAEEESESQSITAMIKKLKDEAAKAQQQNNSSPGSGRGTVTPVSSGKFFCVTGTGYPITSGFGWRRHPVLNEMKFHSGIDIGVPMGTPIHALTDGVVEYAGVMSGYGNVVMINHGNIISLYAHNSSLAVSVGQAVKGGQLISYSGNTGLSSGPHLHFEIRDSNGNPIDPNRYYVR
ncbi:MAG: peptidase [Clostridiaceae bacterium]|jgi:murein DD-endopeptidase MepM/ murein hydrolase activator NlpD|nr:peptidase [Clostridiaceae bacterium]